MYPAWSQINRANYELPHCEVKSSLSQLSYYLGPNIRLGILFSNTPSLWSSLNPRHRVSQPQVKAYLRETVKRSCVKFPSINCHRFLWTHNDHLQDLLEFIWLVIPLAVVDWIVNYSTLLRENVSFDLNSNLVILYNIFKKNCAVYLSIVHIFIKFLIFKKCIVLKKILLKKRESIIFNKHNIHGGVIKL